MESFEIPPAQPGVRLITVSFRIPINGDAVKYDKGSSGIGPSVTFAETVKFVVLDESPFAGSIRPADDGIRTEIFS